MNLQEGVWTCCLTLTEDVHIADMLQGLACLTSPNVVMPDHNARYNAVFEEPSVLLRKLRNLDGLPDDLQYERRCRYFGPGE